MNTKETSANATSTNQIHEKRPVFSYCSKYSEFSIKSGSSPSAICVFCTFSRKSALIFSVKALLSSSSLVTITPIGWFSFFFFNFAVFDYLIIPYTEKV